MVKPSDTSRATAEQIKSGPSLRELYHNHYRIGAAVNSRTIGSQRDLLLYHFNSITAENEMKFESVHPAEDVYTFEQADRIAALAKENDIALRGHALVWHNQTSKWMFEGKDGGLVDKETLFARMKSHIDTVVGRYKGQIYAWDVVNEAVSEEEGELLRQSKWLEIAGPEFIERAFRYAHEADPNAQLFYNDYNECGPVKRDKIYTLVKSLLDKDVPIHGIGLQAHWGPSDPAEDRIREAIEKYASLGLRLHITEMDISVFEWKDHRADLTEPTAEMQERHAERYEMAFRLFNEYKDVIDCVTFWGISDDYTWLDYFPVRSRKNWPFLFDVNHQTKESFRRVAALVQK
ncbi:endo-1,4-beta-xylanase [Paenibacillus kobensis]|uniref:endo-1,4-beta-xylanase n=1 Tax=Paenibacillus kobensis TaxID=59841 RepID=UPI000FD875FD|nr:endo-1,4-beta-xylanase [Paenibacillus kobensis]